MYLLIIILALSSLFICIQEQYQEQYQEPFINKLVLPPLVATRIRPFYRNQRKYYTELFESYSNSATKQMKKVGLV